jgi:hypothetical protein
MPLLISIPPTAHWNSRRHSGGRSSGRRRDGRRANRCVEMQHLLGGTSLKLAFRQNGAQCLLLASSDQLFHKNSEKILLHIFTLLLIPGGSPPVVLFHPGLCGVDYPATSPPGPLSVLPASESRSTAPHGWPSNPSPSHSDIFLTFM